MILQRTIDLLLLLLLFRTSIIMITCTYFKNVLQIQNTIRKILFIYNKNPITHFQQYGIVITNLANPNLIFHYKFSLVHLCSTRQIVKIIILITYLLIYTYLVRNMYLCLYIISNRSFSFLPLQLIFTQVSSHLKFAYK